MVDYDWRGFNAQALFAAIDKLDLSRFIGFVYGSGFEAQPELLRKVAEIVPLIGNSPATLSIVKNPTSFFAALRRLNISHPAVHNALPTDAANVYLQKFAGGSGGTHIKTVIAGTQTLPDEYYYQQKMDGRSISLLFIANGQEIEVVGFNEQWLSPSDSMPFRYGGAVSHVALSHEIQRQLIVAVEELTKTFGLVGLNSLDAIVRDNTAHGVSEENMNIGDASVFVLEINPRLSATVDLYGHTEQNLFERHVQACLSQCSFMRQGSKHDTSQLKLRCKAHAIVYADSDTEVAAAIAWPNWVVDNPAQSMHPLKISAGEPVCTVVAYSDDAETAKKLAQARVEIIKSLIK